MAKAKQPVREWCQQNFDKYPTKEELIENCVKALGVKRKQVLHKLKVLNTNGSSSIGLSENELRAKCDVLFKIESAVKKLPVDRYIPDAEFREFFCQVNVNKYRSKADLPQFEKYKGIASGVTYWSKPENIKRLKESGVFI
jgi:hypothetical protein